MKNCLFAVLFALLCVACTSKTQLLPQARHIKTLPIYEKPQNCKFLGREIGQKIDTWGSTSLLNLRESAINDLKNKAANLGGDTLLVLNMEKGWNSTWGVGEYLVEGEIYKCAD